MFLRLFKPTIYISAKENSEKSIRFWVIKSWNFVTEWVDKFSDFGTLIFWPNFYLRYSWKLHFDGFQALFRHFPSIINQEKVCICLRNKKFEASKILGIVTEWLLRSDASNSLSFHSNFSSFFILFLALNSRILFKIR